MEHYCFRHFSLNKYIAVCYNKFTAKPDNTYCLSNIKKYFCRISFQKYLLSLCTGYERSLIMKYLKRLASTALILTAIVGASVSANAATNTSYYDGAKVSVGRGSNNSWHQVSGVSYPSGKGKLTYVYNGKIQYKYTSGTSYSSYWYGSTSSNGSARAATTTYKSYTLSV